MALNKELVDQAQFYEPPVEDDKDTQPEEVEPPSEREAPKKPKTAKASPGGKAARILYDSLQKHAQLYVFKDLDENAYVTFTSNGHKENYPVRAKKFKRYIRSFHRKRTGGTVSQHVLDEVLNALEADSYDAPAHNVFIRVGHLGDEVYFDTGDDDWNVLKVTPDGWEIVQDSRVKFIRKGRMEPLIPPTKSASTQALNKLRELFNLDDNDWALLSGSLVQMMYPRGPYPCVAIFGEHGSGKSTLVRMLKALIDPSIVPVRSLPRDEGDLVIATLSCWLLAFDNVSSIPPWQSDAFCRLATGGGFGKRELFSDSEEVLINAQRPVVLNGIGDTIISREDLLSRTVAIRMRTIPEERRLPESVVWKRFDEIKSALLGCILNGVSAVLKNADSIKLDRLPRMADMAIRATAAEPALGLEPGAFLRAFAENEKNAAAVVLEGSPLVELLREKLTFPWEGTATELLAELKSQASDEQKKDRLIPSSANALSGRLTRLAPVLRQIGIDYRNVKRNHGSHITLRSISKEPVATQDPVREVFSL